MKRAAVINASKPHYNLGADKIADWLTGRGEYEVTRFDGDPGLFLVDFDLVAISVIFSWHAPIAREIALRSRGKADVWCGGPGMFALKNWWRKETGLEVAAGLDWRFERQRGQYRMTFASRGCPVNCSFCIVPRLEGLEFTLDWDFVPAPILCDNNLSALTEEFQNHIIARYEAAGMRLLDANSGFEPRTFDEATYRRWKPILRGPWRFALDEYKEAAEVRRMMDILKDERPGKKRVYVLVGNEPIAPCIERFKMVVSWGGEPFCQPVMPLNWLGGEIPAKFDWTPRLLKDFARWANRFIWRNVSLEVYEPRKGERPFANLVKPNPLRIIA